MNQLNPLEFEIINAKLKADEAIKSLSKILISINLREPIKDVHTNNLLNWKENYKNLVNRNPFKEFMTIIDEMVLNNISKTETIEDLYWLCQKYEKGNYSQDNIAIDIQTLKTIFHEILKDGIIDENEIIFLEKWLEENYHLRTYYPYDEIRSLLQSIVSDGIIDEEEILILKAYLNHFVELKDNNIAKQINLETADINISKHCTKISNIEFKGKTFCVTGIFKVTTRKELENIIISLGGLLTENVTKKTDFLIVGDNGNSVWALACYGRKIERALEINEDGKQICLVHEYDFMEIIKKN